MSAPKKPAGRYDRIDDLILAAIKSGDRELRYIDRGDVTLEAIRLAKVDRLKDWDVVPIRLDALKRAGKIEFRTLQSGSPKFGWHIKGES